LDLRFSSKEGESKEDESDKKSTQNAKHEGEFIQIVVDITKDCVALRSVFEGADVVFHLASAGMSGCDSIIIFVSMSTYAGQDMLAYMHSIHVHARVFVCVFEG
jgi:hypothetical protein